MLLATIAARNGVSRLKQRAGSATYLDSMADASFNTKATIRLLQESGIEDRQAEAIAEAVRVGVSGGIASTADLAEIRIDALWIKRIGGVLIALGVAATGFLYTEIGSNRDQIQANTAALARIEAILNERLPRD